MYYVRIYVHAYMCVCVCVCVYVCVCITRRCVWAQNLHQGHDWFRVKGLGFRFVVEDLGFRTYTKAMIGLGFRV